MSQSVWATNKASKRSRGQAQRRNPTTFTEEPKTKKLRVEDQDKNEETSQETMERNELQPSPGALVRRSSSSVPRMVISEVAILPTQPAPALDFYAASLYDQSLRRSSAPSCVSIEDALSRLNKDPILNQRLHCFYPARSEKGETVIEICSNLIRLQEGFSAIGSLAQHESKFCALIIAFGFLTRHVGDQLEIRSRTFGSASNYFMAVLGRRSRFQLRSCCVSDKDILFRYSVDNESEHLLVPMVRSFRNREPAWSQVGNVFWEAVGSLALRMPEVDDIVTQVSLMCAVLVDTYILCSHSMSDADFHYWCQNIDLRSFVMLAYAGVVDGYYLVVHKFVARKSKE